MRAESSVAQYLPTASFHKSSAYIIRSLVILDGNFPYFFPGEHVCPHFLTNKVQSSVIHKPQHISYISTSTAIPYIYSKIIHCLKRNNLYTDQKTSPGVGILPMPGQQRRVGALVIAGIPLGLQTFPVVIVIEQVVTNPEKVLRKIVIPRLIVGQYDRPPLRDTFHGLNGEKVGPRRRKLGTSSSCAKTGDCDGLQISFRWGLGIWGLLTDYRLGDGWVDAY